MKKKKRTLFDFFVVIFIGIVLFLTLYPLLYVFSISFSSTQNILQNKVSFLPKGFNIDAYKMILDTARIPRAYLNTFIYTAVGTFINLLMTVLTAYPLARNVKGKKAFMLIIIFTMFFNGGIIPNYLIVRDLNMLNTIWALVIPNAIWTYELIIMKSFYEAIPNEMYRSAKMDGAKEAKILFRIYLPISKAALASIALFYAMGHWNSYLLPSIYLSDLDKMPLQVVLKNMLIDDNTIQTNNMMEYGRIASQGLKNATIVISIVPMLLFYPYLQKYFVKGVMIGSVKG